MAVVYADFVRERGRGARTIRTQRAKTQRAKAYQRATAEATQRVAAQVEARPAGASFWLILLLAPLAGLVVPLLVVPLVGEPQGWVMAGIGFFACVMLLLRVLKQEANYALQRGGR